jgi:3-dehydroquinate dehydratase-1
VGERAVSIGRDPSGPRGAVVVGGPHGVARCRIIVPVSASRPQALAEEVRALAGHPVDLIEWRVDALASMAPDEIARACGVVLGEARRPVLATVRTAGEGGAASLSDTGYARLVAWLARRADAVDVEVARGDCLEGGAAALIAGIHEAGAVAVGSRHDFSGTAPEPRIIEVLRAEAEAGADIAKIAYAASGPLDLLQVMDAQMWARTGIGPPVIAISMGRAGAISRIAGAPLGSAATFATVGAPSAPGQFRAEQVREALDVMEA